MSYYQNKNIFTIFCGSREKNIILQQKWLNIIFSPRHSSNKFGSALGLTKWLLRHPRVESKKGNEVRFLNSTRCCNSRFLTMRIVIEQKVFRNLPLVSYRLGRRD